MPGFVTGDLPTFVQHNSRRQELLCTCKDRAIAHMAQASLCLLILVIPFQSSNLSSRAMGFLERNTRHLALGFISPALQPCIRSRLAQPEGKKVEPIFNFFLPLLSHVPDDGKIDCDPFVKTK